ncbi:MAG: flagellar protein [Lachnospiraceae bacterium]|nr:flagellar protein [Lachnospiraceae bacterium]
MNLIQSKLYSSIEQMTGQLLKEQTKKADSSANSSPVSFADVLKTKESDLVIANSSLRFSKHANQRLSDRNIDLSKEQMQRLENGTSKAREKGINESLVMVDDLAFIVNVKNNTVITAVNDGNDGVFTNIDGAVIS